MKSQTVTLALTLMLMLILTVILFKLEIHFRESLRGSEQASFEDSFFCVKQ